MASSDHYDLIVIGSGPGGGSLAHRLAPTGKRILMLERGGYLPRSRAIGTPRPCSSTAPTRPRTPGTARTARHSIPGCTITSAATPRSMARRCSACGSAISASCGTRTAISPAWPLGYDVFEPYYCEAEALFHVHGQRGEDPTEPWSSTPYAYPPVSHEPRIQA